MFKKMWYTIEMVAQSSLTRHAAIDLVTISAMIALGNAIKDSDSTEFVKGFANTASLFVAGLVVCNAVNNSLDKNLEEYDIEVKHEYERKMEGKSY